MTWPMALFAMLSAIVAVSAAGVAISRSVVRAAVWLLFALIGIAGLYFLLGAEFLGATQLIVYVGGTLVLVVFGAMITNQGPFAVLKTKPVEWVLAGVVGIGLFGLLAYTSLQLAKPMETEAELPNTEAIGQGFLGVGGAGEVSYLLPFEVVSVHLLVVLIAAAYLARAKKKTQFNRETKGSTEPEQRSPSSRG